MCYQWNNLTIKSPAAVHQTLAQAYLTEERRCEVPSFYGYISQKSFLIRLLQDILLYSPLTDQPAMYKDLPLIHP